MNWIKNILITINKNGLKKAKQKQFGYLIIFVLVLFFCVSVYKHGLVYNAKQQTVLVVFTFVTIVTFLQPILLYPFLIIWFFIGEVLGKLTSFLILAIVYYLLLTPIVFILNIFGDKSKYPAKWIERQDTINYDSLS